MFAFRSRTAVMLLILMLHRSVGGVRKRKRGAARGPMFNGSRLRDVQHADASEKTAGRPAPDPTRLKSDISRPVDPSMSRMVSDILDVLKDFKGCRDPRISREEYVGTFTALAAKVFGYRVELASLFVALFGPQQAMKFFQANEEPLRHISIRVNTLKGNAKTLRHELSRSGLNVRTIPHLPAESGIFQIAGNKNRSGARRKRLYASPGSTIEYLEGKYMLQAPSSVLPVLALDPRPGETILDMCAAPGGKSAHLAALMNNTGILVANDINFRRIPALSGNLHRLGISNCIIMNVDATCFANLTKFPKYPRPDKVLLDAPCSGTGIIRRDPSIKKRTVREIHKSSVLQRNLLKAALKLVKPGGIVVYSTCSVTVEENEAVINDHLQAGSEERNGNSFACKVLPMKFGLGCEGITWGGSRALHPTLRNCRRIYPHDLNVEGFDGFFVAKLQKLPVNDPTPSKRKQMKYKRRFVTKVAMRMLKKEEMKALCVQLGNYLEIDKFLSNCGKQLVVIGNRLYYAPDPVRNFAQDFLKHVEAIGICLGHFDLTGGSHTNSENLNFKLEITALGLISRFARIRVYLDVRGSKSFLYGNNIFDERIVDVREGNHSCKNRKIKAWVVVYGVHVEAEIKLSCLTSVKTARNIEGLPIGFGFIDIREDRNSRLQSNRNGESMVLAAGRMDLKRKAILKNLGDLGLYLRAENRLHRRE